MRKRAKVVKGRERAGGEDVVNRTVYLNEMGPGEGRAMKDNEEESDGMQCCCQAHDVAYTRTIAARAHPTQQDLDFRAASTRVGARKFDSYTPRIRLFVIYGVHEGIQLQPDSRYGSACMAHNEDSIHVSVVSPARFNLCIEL